MKHYIILLILVCLVNSGCNDYLDAKPDKKMIVPSDISDLWAILDNYTIMNQSSPVASEDYSDNYYLTEVSYMAITNVNTRNNYIWSDKGERIGDWVNPYRAIFYANNVLDEIKNNHNLKLYNLKEVKGSALFFRSFVFYEIAQIFSKQYSTETESSPGIPLRLTSVSDGLSVRPTLKETYDRIIMDLKSSIEMLPNKSVYKNRPTKAAAYGTLSRIYLNIGNYIQARNYADSCLNLFDTLMDFNMLSTTGNVPLEKFNNEVIFASRSFTESSLLATSRYKIDPALYNSYKDDDLRKSIFFKKNVDNSFTVKGSYDGSYAGAFFNGLATDEQYLILAECEARIGDYGKAMEILNILMKKRISNSTFSEYTASNSSDALDIILIERRKELFLRGLRWSDIRRLNNDPKYYTQLKRDIGSTTIELTKNDKRYVTLIPNKVIENSTIVQNDR